MTKHKPRPKPVASGPVKTLIKKDDALYWLIAGLLLTLIVYFPSLFNGITNWDDNVYAGNSYLKSLSPANIVNLFSLYVAGNYHPLALLSLGIDHYIGGGNPFMFHFTNLLLHLLNTILVFLLVKRLTRNNLLAVFTFILFGVHTLHVESVAWISERKDVLYAFFYLLSLIFYLSHASGRKRLNYWVSLLFFLLSSFSKGQAVTIIIVLPFIDYVMDRKWFSMKVLLEKLPFLILALIFAVVAFRAQESAGALNKLYFTLPERFAFASFGFVQYLIKSVFPIGLSIFYPFPPRLTDGSIPSFYWFFVVAFPLFFTGFYFLFKRSKIYALGLGMFFLTLLPVLQFIPVGGSLMADRYFYIPSVGLLLCFGLGLTAIRNTRIRYAVFILFALFLSGLSFARCMVWKDSIILWSDVISKYDYIEDAYYHRGIAYGNNGQWDKAIADYSRVIAINPKHKVAYSNRGAAYENLGQWEKAIADCSGAIKIDPKYTEAYSNRSIAYANLGQWARAIADCSKAISIDPKYTDAYYNRSVVYGNLRQWDKEVADCSRIIEIDPKYASAYYNRGYAYGNLRQWEKAIADFTKTIELDPNYSQAYSNRDFAYQQLNSLKKQ
jgi:protein O-mannosyl-transferase